jgi:hypothetical protein
VERESGTDKRETALAKIARCESTALVACFGNACGRAVFIYLLPLSHTLTQSHRTQPHGSVATQNAADIATASTPPPPFHTDHKEHNIRTMRINENMALIMWYLSKFGPKAFAQGWAKLPDELKIEILRYCLPSQSNLDEDFSPGTDRRKQGLCGRPAFSTNVLPLLACPATKDLAT